MSGYGFTAAGTTYDNEDRLTGFSRAATSGPALLDQQTIADYPVGGAATTPTFRYVYASYIDEPVVRKTAGTGGTLVYFHRNHQYSVTAVTTSTGAIAERYTYSAYGHPTILDASGTVLQTSNFSLRYSFTGREWDATLGLYHFRARWMNPSAGRFLGRDPIGYRGGAFLYVAEMSLDRWDPSGLSTSLGDCQKAADAFIDNNIKGFKTECNFDLVATCKNCKSKENPDPPGGETKCSKDKKSIEITICWDRLNDIDGVNRILRHEFQHAKNICSCKEGYNIRNIPRDENGNVPESFCDKMACLELRACKVADCAGKRGDALKTCLIHCASGSMSRSGACKKMAGSSTYFFEINYLLLMDWCVELGIGLQNWR